MAIWYIFLCSKLKYEIKLKTVRLSFFGIICKVSSFYDDKQKN